MQQHLCRCKCDSIKMLLVSVKLSPKKVMILQL